MSAAWTPWFDRSAPLPRAWPPAAGAAADEALRDIARHDRYGQALHLASAVLFAFAAPLDHLPNSIAMIALLTVSVARAVRFPALYGSVLRWAPAWFGLAWIAALLAALALAPGETAPRTLHSLRYLLVPVALFPLVAGDRRCVGLLARALIAAAVLNAAVQVAQRFGFLLPVQGASWRPSGLAALPAVAAINAGSAIILALALGSAARGRSRIILLASIAPCAAGMVLAASRQPILALPVGVAALLAVLLATRRIRPREIVGLVLPPAILAVPALLLFGGRVVDYFAAAATEMSGAMRGEAMWSSLQLRLFWWRIGIEQFLAHPWTGGGPGSFRPFLEAHPGLHGFLSESGIDRGEVLQLHPHSTYVRSLAETGIAGALALGALLGSVLACGWRNARRGPVEAAGALAAFVFVLLCTATECVELMNVCLAHAVVLAAIAAIPRADRGAPL